jgi:hypothetical protein
MKDNKNKGVRESAQQADIRRVTKTPYEDRDKRLNELRQTAAMKRPVFTGQHVDRSGTTRSGR